MIIIITIIGILIGSFLNVCIIRIPKKTSVAYPPSHCTSCGTNLKPIDLIPILSYLFYKGKCRYCGENVSLQYPIIESLTGIIFLLAFNTYGFSLEFIFYVILFCTLVVISCIDYYHQIILDGLVKLSLAVGVIFKLSAFLFYGQTISFINSLIGLLIGGGFLFLIAIISKGGMGGGDIKLMAVLGFWLGWEYTILALLLSFILGGILSLIVLVLRIKSREDAIPFGPFLSLGFIITVLYGENIVEWYMNMFL